MSDRPYVLTQKLLIFSVDKFYGRHHELVDLYERPFFIWQWIISHLLRYFFFYHGQNLYQSWLWVTREASYYKTQELSTVRQHLCSPYVFCGGHVARLVSFLFCFIFCLCFVDCLPCCLWPCDVNWALSNFYSV